MNSLQEYGDLFLRLNLSELTVEEGNKKLCLKRYRTGSYVNPEVLGMASVPAGPFAATGSSASAAGAEVSAADVSVKSAESTSVSEGEKKSECGTTVKAPLLGIFTSSVKAGDRVKTGDALCVIEAMKMMNEVVSPTDGTVSRVLPSDGDLVEFDQELFVIE